MNILLGLIIGVGLSAACGFRIFVPLLGISIANYAGHLTLTSGFEWMGSQTSIIVFSIATALEIGAYYIPWLDNFLDSISIPASIIAGTILTAAMVGDISPLLKWSLAIIAGGGAAGIVQTTTAVIRGTSTVTTAGIGNPVISTLELIISLVGTLISILMPVLAALFIIVIALFIIRKLTKKKAMIFTQSDKSDVA